MSEWYSGVLSDLAEIMMGQSPAGETCNANGNGFPLLNGPTEFGVKFPTPAQFTTDPKKIGKANDILFCVRGSTTGRMNWADQKYALGRGLASIRHKQGEEYRYFVKGVIDYNLSMLLASATGSTFPNISKDQLQELAILIPPLSEQKAIANVLSSLDDKIDLLHHQNKTLESMAETFFRQWFIEEARDDWEDGTIADLIDFNPLRKLSKGSVAPYLEMASLNNSTFNPDDWYDRAFSSGTKFINRDTLLARITPCLENGKTAYVTFLDKNQVGWGSTEYIVMRPKGELHPFFAYALARNTDFRAYAEGCLAGSSGRQRVEIQHLENYVIKIPSPDIVSEFNSLAGSITAKLHSNFLQLRTLEKLRDTLLPKLMSGEVTVII